MTYSVQRIHHSLISPLVIIYSNKVVDSLDAGKKKLAQIEPPIQGLVHLPTSVKWTRSHNRRKQEKVKNVSVCLDKFMIIEFNVVEEREETRESFIDEMQQRCQKTMEGATTLSAMKLSS